MLTPTALALAMLLAPAEELTLDPPQTILQEPRIEWFAGSWDELIERAGAQERLVFVEFWTSWCNWCRKLEKTTLTDATVVAELGDVMCYSIDAESERGRPLAERFHVRNYPTLVFLDPDGETRDVIVDYHGPKDFVAELRRIKRNEGTIGRLRERIRADAGDLEARFRLALKLEKLGDDAGHAEQIDAILRADPEGKSPIVRKIRLSMVLKQVQQDLKLEPVYAFLADEQDPELLFPAWQAIWSYERYHFDRSSTPEEAEQHRLKWLSACRALWQYVPDELRARVGNNVAWYIFEYREHVDIEDLRFALSVAERAAALAPMDPPVIDTLACCQFAVGMRDQAVATIERCIELDPKNPQWRKRLEEFTAGTRRDG